MSVASRCCVDGGAVALLFSDIEGSTSRWERYGQAMGEALRAHDALVRGAIERGGGRVFETLGDSFYASFATVPDAVAAAVAVQRVLGERDWSDVAGLRVRLAVHVGTLEEHDGAYAGAAVERASQLLGIGHGGQILISQTAVDAAAGAFDPEVVLRDCGTHRFKDLGAAERVLQVEAPGLPSAFPQLRSLDFSPNNLPLQPRGFVGRKAEIGAIKEMLRDSRLVTLTGTGGIGKTRTALQVAAEIATSYSDGVWFVELAPHRDGRTLAAELASILAVNASPNDDLLERVARALRFKRALLIFDNCERHPSEAAAALEKILSTAPNVRAIATSREGLGIAGERVFRLPSLDLVPATAVEPRAGHALRHSAVALFVSRARSALPEFALTDANAPTVAAICRSLDGIPFAIELAAPRLRSLSAVELADRLGERFGARDAAPGAPASRRQTMRAMIDWSFDLLSDEEGVFFRRLAILRDGWTLDAASALCGDGRDALALSAALLEKSLIAEISQGGARRFALLDSARAYAREKLDAAGETAALERAHAQYFAGVARATAAARATSSDLEWLRLASAELENVRAALQWSLRERNDPPLGIEILFDYLPLWTLALRAEGAAWTRAADDGLDRAAHPASAAKVLAALALYATGQAERVARSAVALEAARAVGDDALLRFVLTQHGRNLLDSTSYAAGAACLHEALALHRAAGDRRNTAIVLSYLADVGRWIAAPEDPRALYDEALALAREARAERAQAIALGSIAELESDEGRVENAAAVTTIALELFATLRDVRNAASSHCNLAGYAIARDAYAEARLHARLALAILREQEDPFLLALALEHLAVVLGLEGDVSRAARLAGFSDAAYRRLAFTREVTERRGYERLRALLETRFEPADLELLSNAGAALTSDEALAEALA